MFDDKAVVPGQKTKDDKPVLVSDYYGITGIPCPILIGADGKVISLNARGEELKEQLAKIYGPIEDEPAADEPAADEPAADEPAADEPAADETVTDESTAEKPAVQQQNTRQTRATTSRKSRMQKNRQHLKYRMQKMLNR